MLSGGEGNGETERRENRENSVPAAEAATEAAIVANGSGAPPPARVSPGDDLGSSCEHAGLTVSVTDSGGEAGGNIPQISCRPQNWCAGQESGPLSLLHSLLRFLIHAHTLSPPNT